MFACIFLNPCPLFTSKSLQNLTTYLTVVPSPSPAVFFFLSAPPFLFLPFPVSVSHSLPHLSPEVLGSSAGSWSPPGPLRLWTVLQEDGWGGSSEAMGRGRWPMPVGCCRPAACSSDASADTSARRVASSSCDQGLEGERMRRRNRLCHFCRSWNTRLAV